MPEDLMFEQTQSDLIRFALFVFEALRARADTSLLNILNTLVTVLGSSSPAKSSSGFSPWMPVLSFSSDAVSRCCTMRFALVDRGPAVPVSYGQRTRDVNLDQVGTQRRAASQALRVGELDRDNTAGSCELRSGVLQARRLCAPFHYTLPAHHPPSARERLIDEISGNTSTRMFSDLAGIISVLRSGPNRAKPLARLLISVVKWRACQHSSTTSIGGGLPTTFTASSQHDETFETIDLTAVTSEEAYQKLSQAARTTGVMLVSNLPRRPPVAAIQSLFARLYADRSLAARLNATYPKRGVFKDACLAPNASPQVDQKTTIDLSVSRLQFIRKMDPTLVESSRELRRTSVAFKEVISKKWRRREGTEPGEVEERRLCGVTDGQTGQEEAVTKLDNNVESENAHLHAHDVLEL
ncbi:hypothetical protein HBI16_250500 [Parastagonospora nodorum]|nr:hypothetical protein HBI16_250500 [Parastagonospora nodorum]